MFICTQNIECKASVNDEWRQTDKFINSGIYTYRIINEADKSIEIRGINSQEPKITIPQTIDGYNVVSIGYCGSVSLTDLYSAHDLFNEEDFASLKLKGCEETLSELVIPDGVKFIGACAFRNYKNLTKVVLNNDLTAVYGRSFEGCELLDDINIPTETRLGEEAFYGCKSLKNITLSCTNMIGVDQLFNSSDFDYIHFTSSDVEESSRNMCIDMYIFDAFNNINKVVVDPEIIELTLDRNVNELVINGKNTKVISNRASVDINKTKIKTVQGAKAVLFAKKNKLCYEVKHADKVKGVKRKKIDSKFVYNWNKCKTHIVSYKYHSSSKKWKSIDKNINTKYNLYGKMNKGDEYQLLDTIGKTKFKTKYKFIKVQSVTNW